MEVNKLAIKTVLVTLGCAFVLLSVNEWKKFADQMPASDSTYGFAPVGSLDHPNTLVCVAQSPINNVTPPVNPPSAGNPVMPPMMSYGACSDLVGTNFPWTQGIKSLVYTWIGVGLLVAAFIKKKGGVSGGYW